MDKVCHKCDESKPTTEFRNRKSAADGLSYYCKSCLQTNDKGYYKKNHAKCIQAGVKYTRNRRKTDITFRLRALLNNRTRIAITSNLKQSSTIKLLGCTILQARKYIESQFKPGMNWSNHSLTGWHIDHKLPCAAFDLTKESEQRKCFHYTNLQPLWAHENLSKSDNI
jgi:hypothetical protein